MAEERQVAVNGDALLSAHDLSLWRLVQRVLLTWGTLVVLKNEHYSVPDQRDGLVTFFVPRDATFKDEIVAFLEREGKQFASEGWEARPERGIPRIPPTHVKVEVVTFSGLLPYIESEQSEVIAREFVLVAMQRVKSSLTQSRRDAMKDALEALEKAAIASNVRVSVDVYHLPKAPATGVMIGDGFGPGLRMTSGAGGAVEIPELRLVTDPDVIVEPTDTLSMDVEVWIVDDYERWVSAREENRSCDRTPIKTYQAVETTLSGDRVGQFLVEDLADSMVGLKIGEFGEAEADLPGDYEVEKGRNEPAVLRMKVLGVKRPVVKS